MNNESMCKSCKHLHEIEYFDRVSDTRCLVDERCVHNKDINVYAIKNCNKWQEKADEMQM